MLQRVLQIVHLYSDTSFYLQPKRGVLFAKSLHAYEHSSKLHVNISNPLFQLPLHHLVKFLQEQQVLQVCLSLGVLFRNRIDMGKYFYITSTSVVLTSRMITAHCLHRMPHNFFSLIYRLTRFMLYVFRPEVTSVKGPKVRQLQRELWKVVRYHINLY